MVREWYIKYMTGPYQQFQEDGVSLMECQEKSFTSPFGGGSAMGNEMHEEFKTVSGHACNGLFSIGKDEIVHVPRTENLEADSLARSARKQPSFVVHMDGELQI
uniref:Uncharacterized protein n=1 Tax=Brassica oleracea TaxID=3712 RepID=Q2A9Q3_BRAOL|nr:hypothetical protein 26.t00013 [Brassica oleracea]